MKLILPCDSRLPADGNAHLRLGRRDDCSRGEGERKVDKLKLQDEKEKDIFVNVKKNTNGD